MEQLAAACREEEAGVEAAPNAEAWLQRAFQQLPTPQQDLAFASGGLLPLAAAAGCCRWPLPLAAAAGCCRWLLQLPLPLPWAFAASSARRFCSWGTASLTLMLSLQCRC